MNCSQIGLGIRPNDLLSASTYCLFSREWFSRNSWAKRFADKIKKRARLPFLKNIDIVNYLLIPVELIKQTGEVFPQPLGIFEIQTLITRDDPRQNNTELCHRV